MLLKKREPSAANGVVSGGKIPCRFTARFYLSNPAKRGLIGAGGVILGRVFLCVQVLQGGHLEGLFRERPDAARRSVRGRQRGDARDVVANRRPANRL